MSSTTRALLMATTWRHKEGPKVVDICGGQLDFLLHSLEFTIVAQPRRVASPVLGTAPELSLPVVPVTAPGAHWRVGAVFAPGKAGVNAISLPGAAWVLSPVWLPGAAGTPGDINAPGAAWAVSVEIGAGARTTPSAALNLSTSWATGKGSITGVAPGAAWTNNVAWATGKASVSLVVAPGAALAAGVAWAPGSAFITGGTAPGAQLALATAWQPGGAQGIAPGAAWSVSAVWVGGAGSVPGTDPTFSNVSLLLPLDGANNSTTFTDFSSSNFSMTRHGNAVITTTDPKYGTGSLLLQSTGDYISTPENSVFEFGTGDFTVECHCLFTSAENNGLFTFGQLALSVFSGNWWLTTTGLGGTPMGLHMAANTWAFVRVTRTGSSLRLFVDDVQVGNTLTNATNLTGSTCAVGMYFSGGYTWLGKIDNFRVTKGVARTDSPPTGPFPTS